MIIRPSKKSVWMDSCVLQDKHMYVYILFYIVHSYTGFDCGFEIL